MNIFKKISKQTWQKILFFVVSNVLFVLFATTGYYFDVKPISEKILSVPIFVQYLIIVFFTALFIFWIWKNRKIIKKFDFTDGLELTIICTVFLFLTIQGLFFINKKIKIFVGEYVTSESVSEQDFVFNNLRKNLWKIKKKSVNPLYIVIYKGTQNTKSDIFLSGNIQEKKYIQSNVFWKPRKHYIDIDSLHQQGYTLDKNHQRLNEINKKYSNNSLFLEDKSEGKDTTYLFVKHTSFILAVKYYIDERSNMASYYFNIALEYDF